MKVEQENFFFAIFSSVQRRRRWFGTSFVIAWAKSAFTTSASARYSPRRVLTPTARRPSNRICLTSSPSENVTPSSRGDAAHRLGDRRAAADRVPDAVLVLQERQDREEARAVEGGHPEVLGLEREGEADARIAEVASQVAIERFPGPDDRQEFQELPAEEVLPAEEGSFETRLKPRHLVTVLVEEALDVSRIVGVELRDLRLQTSDVGRAVDRAAGAEGDAILRVEAHHRAPRSADRDPPAERSVRGRAGRGRTWGRGRSENLRPRSPNSAHPFSAAARRRAR